MAWKETTHERAPRPNKLRQENDRLRDTLEFYATAWKSENYQDVPTSELLYDAGDKARRALGDD